MLELWRQNYGITELQSGGWFADALHAQAPVYCMYMYNVQISPTSLVFVSECNTHSHTAVWFLLLQADLQQPLDRASWWSFECYHPTWKPVSVYHCRGSVWFFPFNLPVIISLQWLYNAPEQESQLSGFGYFLLYSRKPPYKEGIFGSRHQILV